MTAIPARSAQSLGYRMPAEWAPHACCWMAFPDSDRVWGQYLENAQQHYADVANAIAGFEPVRLLTPPRAEARARRLCGEGVEVIPWDLDDAWMRDIGPNFLVNDQGELAAAVFHFNAWGRKYTHYRKDAALGHQLCEALDIPCFTSPLFLEGGGIFTDGQGTLLTTKQCVLNDNRNPDLGLDEATRELCSNLGMEKVVWLKGDPWDEETDGHVDGIACWTEPGVVLFEHDPLTPPGCDRDIVMRENLDILASATDTTGSSLQVVDLHAAADVPSLGERFHPSYINFYIANGGVVMPAYGSMADAAAHEVVAACFPGREVVQVEINYVAYGGGGIHCITQQQPEAGP